MAPDVKLMGPMDNQRRKRRTGEGRKREQIRRAAYLCFRESGYHDTTVDAVCQRCAISKGSFYWHYNSKQDVFIDILETWAREVMDELYEQFEEAMSQDDAIGPLTGALEREIHRGRVLIPLWLEFSVHARRDKEIQEKLSKFYRRARTAISEILRPVLEKRFSEQELQSIAATIFGAYTGLMIQDLSDPERADAREVIRRFMGVVEWWLRMAQDGTPAAPPPRRTALTGDRLDADDLDDFLSAASDAAAARTRELRELLLRTTPEADERLIKGWRVIAFASPRGLVAYLKPRADDVLLGFYHGANLPDPQQLLQGSGKLRRHVALPAEGDLPSVALKDLIEAAVAFQRI